MLDLGTVKPGTTIYIPFHTFSSDDPSASMTITGLATTDIEVYKDGGTTQRASDAGYSLLDTDGIDFDGITGIHGVSIDLADNTTANFYEAGSQYWVVISSITLDAATINFIAATFRIGYPGAVLDTTIATLSTQTSFTLEDGSANDNAYNGCVAYIHDLASAVQVAIGIVSDYTGATKTVTLAADPAIFTMAAGDNISLFVPSNVHAWNAVPLATTNPLPNAAADAAGGLPISDAGGLDLDTQIGTDIDAILADTNEMQGKLPTNNIMGSADKNDHDTDIDAILVDTNALNDTKIPDTISLANINAEVDTALADIKLDHLINIAVDTDFATTVHEDSVIGEIAQRGGANLWDRSTDSLEALRNTAPIGTAMRGTDNAALASVCTEARLAELGAANLPADIDAILADTGTDGVVVASINANAVTSSAIATGAIDADAIAANAITDAKIASNAITAAKIATDAITAAKIAADAITSSELATSACDKVWDSTGSITSSSFELLLERTYEMINNKMTVNETTGAVALRNIGDSADVATGNVASSSGTTTRAELSWV